MSSPSWQHSLASSRIWNQGPKLVSGIISLASVSDLLYCAERAGPGPRFMIMATVLDDIPAPAG